VYVADWLVLSTLTADEITRISNREVKFDSYVRRYIRDRLTYRWLATADGRAARKLESEIRKGALPAGRPLLNPKAASPC
jgi:hypothetical protein